MGKKNSRYQDKKFANEQEFNAWLDKTQTMIIDFEDNGQDLLRIWTDEYGEILHSNAQTQIWCGRFVKLECFVTEPICMWDADTAKWQVMGRLVIELITYK
jgi:hypothetical protein